MACAPIVELPPLALPARNTFLDFSPVCRDFHDALPRDRGCRTCPSSLAVRPAWPPAAAAPTIGEQHAAGCEADWGSDVCSTADTSEAGGELAAEAAGALPSLGSADHASGQCKPCAFLHKKRGCNLGTECPFCHLCGRGEKKRRQKEKRVLAPSTVAGAQQTGAGPQWRSAAALC